MSICPFLKNVEKAYKTFIWQSYFCLLSLLTRLEYYNERRDHVWFPLATDQSDSTFQINISIVGPHVIICLICKNKV